MNELGVEDPSVHIKQEAADYHAAVSTDPHSNPNQVNKSSEALGKLAIDSGDEGFFQRAVRRVMRFGQGHKTLEQIKSGT